MAQDERFSVGLRCTLRVSSQLDRKEHRWLSRLTETEMKDFVKDMKKGPG